MDPRASTGYRLRVTFRGGKPPSWSDIKQLLSDHQLVLDNVKDETATVNDVLTRAAFQLEVRVEEPQPTVGFDVPYDGPVRLLLLAYSAAQTLAERFNGSLEDPQLGRVPSPFLAKQEWKKRASSSVLNTAFRGEVPLDLKTKLVQRRFMEARQELKITGDEIEIVRKVPFKSEQYSVPVLSLDEPQEFTRPNNKWFFVVIFGFLFFVEAAVLPKSGTLESSILQLIGWATIFSSIPLYWRFRRHLIAIPGYGGNLLIDASSPSREEVRKFLDSIERVKVALARYRLPLGGEEPEVSGVI